MKEYIEQIDQLLDGELDQMHESGLYAELSVNADLRQELREHLALKSAVKDDRMALVPPAMLTNSVFSGLGFAAPFAGAAATTVGTSVVWHWLTRLGIPLLSAITAAGVSWGVASGNFADFVASSGAVVSNSQQQQPTATEQQAVAGNEQPQQQQPTATDIELRATNNELRATNNELRATIGRLEREHDLALSNRGTVELSTVEPTTVAPEPSNRGTMEPTTMTSSLMLNNTITLQRDDTPEAIRLTQYAVQPPIRSFKGLTAQVRGMSLAPTVDISSTVNEQSEWYSNLGLAFMYQMNARSSLGFEVGNESYPMVFQGDRNGQIIQYEQFPSTLWAGVTYRYTFGQFGEFPMAPYVQGLVGGSRFGPMGRAQIGLQYAPSGPLMFLLGFEGSAMTYSFQNTNYISPKFGLTYGMAIRF